MPSITVPKEFFEKERAQAYVNWHESFWRELLANSLDAGATSIQISFLASGDVEELHQILFSDNGPGMSRQVCKDIYLALGKTTKQVAGSTVGGFGRARVMTCFAMERYQIISQDYLLEGQNAHYDLHDNSWTEGFHLSVWDHFDLHKMRQGLETVLRQSAFPFDIRITVDSVPYENIVSPLELKLEVYNPLLAEDQSVMGRVAFVPSAISKEVYKTIVRVNGLAMFTEYASNLSSGALVIDLDPAKSREYMTGNRDGGTAILKEAVGTLMGEIANEGIKVVTTTRSVNEIIKITTPSGLRRFKKDATPESTPKDWWAREANVGNIPVNKPSRASILTEIDLDLPCSSLVYSVSTANPDLIARKNKWDPTQGLDLLTEEERALIVGWDKAIELALETLKTCIRAGDFYWGIGILLHDSHIAQCLTLGSEHYFLINHYKSELKFNWSRKTNPKVFRDLWASAVHEVVHVVEPHHDADYAYKLTEMICNMDQTAALWDIHNAMTKKGR